METLKHDSKSGKTLNRYVCMYCGEIFEKWVKKTMMDSKHKNYSTMVVCPQCKNFMKTWGG